MNVLFEEDGAFRAGTILTDNGTSLQVELASGKRAKVKVGNVLLRFDDMPVGDLLSLAEQASVELDVSFLWEACPDAEFGFEEFAREYAGHSPGSVESTSILLCLHAAPMYFHRKGRGRFRKAPPEILQAALAGQEKKRQQALAVAQMAEALEAGQLPVELASMLGQLLYKPDRNRPETKALEIACSNTGLSAPRLLWRCGAFKSTHDYQIGRFLFEHFPHGTDFPDFAPVAAIANLPLAAVQAFSIDDAHTTEIDDAFSLEPLPDGGMCVGIHIAAPGLGITPETDLGQVARHRLSTVYMPGRKITMLPESAIDRFTLAAGRMVPAVSLYLTVNADLQVISHATRLENVPVVANLRHHDLEPLFNEATIADGLTDFPFRDELFRLWQLACVLEAGRGKPSATPEQKDYNFIVDWSVMTEDGPGRVTIEGRPRGSPLDKLVAELMIVANSTWGALLRDAGVPALYRVQTVGKVRMTTVAAAHEGLGVDCYAWSSSPLRRFVDLANQWQLIAHLRGEKPYYGQKSAELLAALRDFELTYAAYAEFQRDMERYWCLRWIGQTPAWIPVARVIRDDLVRLVDLPLVLKVSGMPSLARGTSVQLAIERIDLFDASCAAAFVGLMATPATELDGFDTADEPIAIAGDNEVAE